MRNNKYIKFILSSLIVISALNLISYNFNIGISNLVTTLKAETNDINKDYLILKHPATENIILINQNSTIKIEGVNLQGETFSNDKKEYLFQQYNPINKTILVKNKKLNVFTKSKDAYTTFKLDDIRSFSMRLNEFKDGDYIAGLVGGIIGGWIGIWPSAIVGCLGASAVSGGELYFDDKPLGQIVYIAITIGGTALSAKSGYKLGKNMKNPYQKIYLTGTNSWTIFEEDLDNSYQLNDKF